jgi:hypothetical protein
MEEKNAYKFSMGSLKGSDHLEDQGMDGRVLLDCILKKENLKI